MSTCGNSRSEDNLKLTNRMQQKVLAFALLFLAGCSNEIGGDHLRPWPDEVTEIETSVDCGAGIEYECSRKWVLEPLTDLEQAVAAVEGHIADLDLTPLPGNDPCWNASCANISQKNGIIHVYMSYTGD